MSCMVSALDLDTEAMRSLLSYVASCKWLPDVLTIASSSNEIYMIEVCSMG